jgi:hypothetical protein
MTKTLRPVLSPPDAPAEEDVEAAGDAAAVEGADEDEEDDDEQAASAGRAIRSGRASHVARLSLIVCILSIFGWMFDMSLLVGGG